MNISLFWHANIRCIYPPSHWGHHFCFHKVNVMFLCRTNPLYISLFKIFACFERFVCSDTFFAERFISAFRKVSFQFLEMSNSGTSFKWFSHSPFSTVDWNQVRENFTSDIDIYGNSFNWQLMCVLDDRSINIYCPQLCELPVKSRVTWVKALDLLLILGRFIESRVLSKMRLLFFFYSGNPF